MSTWRFSGSAASAEAPMVAFERNEDLLAVLVVGRRRLRLDSPLRSPVVRPRPHEVPGLHPALALDQDRSPWLADELVLQQLVRLARDLDLAGRSMGLHPTRRVHGVAPAIGEETFRAEHPGDDRTAVAADPQLET